MEILEELERAEVAASARFVEFTEASLWVRMCVTSARADGHTWQEISDALGMTRQGAQQRFGKTTDPYS
jgi:hypothetical protein